ncbi:MAG: polyprenyl synthetase family protein [Candidatus Brocadiia bacterium]
MGEQCDVEDSVHSVRRLLRRNVREAVGGLNGEQVADLLLGGKMLRTRLAVRAAQSENRGRRHVERACVAVELVHTATLCHDDVIDGATLRRGRPALWRQIGPRAAVLVGDLLLSRAFEVVALTDPITVRTFAACVREVALTEAVQELDGTPEPSEAERLRLARGKTGPLFAFAARAAGGEDTELRDTLQEAGYRIGTAYQLADDLLDVVGSEPAAGKTLGTDAQRGVPTLPGMGPEGRRLARRRLAELCRSATALLAPWPPVQEGVSDYLSQDLQPVLDRHLPGLRAAPGRAFRRP